MRLFVTSCASVLAAVALTSVACDSSSVSGVPSAGGGGADATASSSASTGGGGSGGTGTGGGGAPWMPSTPLYMTHAVLTDGLTVHVTFSEAPIVPSGLDVTDFRLSATVLMHRGVPSCTSCGDLNYYCTPHTTDCYYGSTYTPPRDQSLYEDVGPVVGVAPSGDGLDVTIARGLPYDASIGLSLHYAPGASPITDAAGDTLSPEGADWVHDTAPSTIVPGLRGEGAVAVDNHILASYHLHANSCGDGVVDATETDVDCGGTVDQDTMAGNAPDATLCPRCDPGKKCLADSDCSSQSCVLGRCAM